MRVTPRQNECLLALKGGPKTSRELQPIMKISVNSIGKVLKKLREKKILKAIRMPKAHGNTLHYALIKPYDQMLTDGMEITKVTKGTQIVAGEIFYAAILRNAGMTGQELTGQYNKVYPERAINGISNIIDKARKRGLCR